MIDAFKIGITISLVNRASSGLAALSRDFAKADASAAAFEKRVKSIQAMALAGGALFGAGFVGIELTKGLYEAGKAYTQAYAQFQALNLGDLVNKDADNFARGTHIMGASATDLMNTLSALHTVMGNYDEARALAPAIAKMEFANKAVFTSGPMAGKFDDRQAGLMGKVVEMRGGFRSEEEMNRQVDMMQRVMSGTSGMVMPSEYHAFLKTGGVAARMMSDEQFYFQMEPLIQEVGGSRTGTALMSAYQNIEQGRTTLKAAMELVRLGILDPKDILHSGPGGKGGMFMGIRPGAVQGADLVGTDPVAMVKNVLLPAFAAHGIDIHDQKAVLNEIGTVFSNRTAAALYSLIYQQMDKIAKNVAIDKGAKGVSELTAEAENTPEGRELKVEKAWENLRIELGLNVIPVILPMLDKLATGLQALSDAARDHPLIAEGLTGALMTFTALGTAGGGLLLGKAGFDAAKLFLEGIVGLPLRSLAGAAALFAPGAEAASGIAFLAGAAGLAALAAAIVAFIAKVGSDFETPATHAAQEKLSRERRALDGGPNGPLHDGFGPDGRPLAEALGSDRRSWSDGYTRSAPPWVLPMPLPHPAADGQPASPFVPIPSPPLSVSPSPDRAAEARGTPENPMHVVLPPPGPPPAPPPPPPGTSPSNPAYVLIQNLGDMISGAVASTVRTLTDQATAPKSGTSNPNPRVGPLMPGVPSVYVSP